MNQLISIDPNLWSETVKYASRLGALTERQRESVFAFISGLEAQSRLESDEEKAS